MINYIFYTVTELRGFIILELATLALMTMLVIVFAARKKKSISSFGEVQRLFLGLSVRELLYLTFGVSLTVFVVSMVLFRMDFDIVEIATLVMLVAARLLTSPHISLLLSEGIVGVLSAASFIIGKLLLDFMDETGFDFYIFLIWALLSLFVIAYACYHLIKTTGKLSYYHERRRRNASQI